MYGLFKEFLKAIIPQEPTGGFLNNYDSQPASLPLPDDKNCANIGNFSD